MFIVCVLLALPRYSVFRDVFDYIYSGKLTPTVAENMTALLSRPVTNEVQMQHLDIISRIR